jgi:hypothetical protein
VIRAPEPVTDLGALRDPYIQTIEFAELPLQTLSDFLDSTKKQRVYVLAPPYEGWNDEHQHLVRV